MIFDLLWGFASEELVTREIFGNHSLLSKRIFYALSAAALAIFAWGYYRRARLWRLGRRGDRGLRPLAVLKHLLVDVLLQRRVLGRGWASLGHVLLFGGFMGLLLATILLSIEHWLAGLLGRAVDDPVFHKGTYFEIYEGLADGFGLALLAGCGIFAVRRWRGTGNFGRRPSDWWALGALAFLGVTGYVVEGLRIIYERTPQPGVSFVGVRFAQAFQAIGLDPTSAATIHFYSWWVHAFVSLLFVATIPYARLVHSVTAALRLAFSPDQLGVMTRLDAADVEATGLIGVGEIQHFTRLQLLELDTCMSCGRCEAACPAFEAGKPLSPRNVVQDLRGHLDRMGPLLLAGAAGSGEISAGPASTASGEDERYAASMHGDVISAATLWSCTTCSACVDVCPVGVDPLRQITDMRRHLIGEGQFRGSPAKALQSMGRVGNPWGMAPQDRMEWAAGLDVPIATNGSEFDVLYWVGCAASYDRRIQKVARSVVQLLKAANVRFAVLGNEERCTGESARRMGDEFLFQELAAQNVETLARHEVRRGAKLIISHCPHCVNSFKQDYPQMGGDYEVVHHSEYLAKLVTEGRLPGQGARNEEQGARSSSLVTYHDPCYLARVGGVTEAPRELLQIATGQTTNGIVEMPRNRRATSCCGAGGGRMWFDDPPSERVGTARIEEALETGAQTVAVGCPFCLVMMSDGIAARQSAVEVKDVAELLAESLNDEAGEPKLA